MIINWQDVWAARGSYCRHQLLWVRWADKIKPYEARLINKFCIERNLPIAYPS